MSVSAVVLTKNEEKNIENCLKSLDFCDEIIVIDDNSSDKTVQIAKKYKAVIYTRILNNDFAGQRNYGMEKAKGEWVLFVDADEEVTDELKQEIKQITSPLTLNPLPLAFYIKRRDFFWGKELKHGETKKVRNKGIMRLVKKNMGKWVGKIHEEFKTDAEIGALNAYLNHYPHQTVKEFIEDVNFYSTLRAKELFSNNKKTNIFEIVLLPFGKFVYTYFLKLGFLDGSPGFAYSFFMSFHSFLVRSKLYQYWEIDGK